VTDPPRIGLFDRPTAVYLSGSSRSLLNWVAYALCLPNAGGYLWTDVQLDGEVREPDDLLGTSRIPVDRFFEVSPEALVLDPRAGNVALGGLIQTTDSAASVETFVNFLRLPAHAQTLVSKQSRSGPPTILILSNSHRIAALYSWRTTGPAVRSIVAAGVSLLVTWADAPTESRHQFDYVLHLKGHELARWRDAVVIVEKGAPDGPLRSGSERRLAEFPGVDSALSEIR